jgi:general stress protein CsbA
MGVLLFALLIVLLFLVLGFTVVKFLIWVAIVLGLIWLIGFFVRGVEGARWYRW